MIDFDECVREGYLRKIPPSVKQAEDQLKKSEMLLEEAKKSIGIKAPNTAVIAAYTAVLDAARAVLFRDGYREKSHMCVVKYLEAKYSAKLGTSAIILFDQYRDKRHKTMYSGDYYPTMEEAERMVKFAEEFIQKIKKLF